MRTLEELSRVVSRYEGRLEDAKERLSQLGKQVPVKEDAYSGLLKAAGLLQEVASATQNQLRQSLESAVQGCMDLLFPGYRFQVEFIPKRGKTEAAFHIVKDGSDLDPMSSSGGGVVDTISFALRAGCLRLSGKRPILVLDEPFKHVRGEPRKELGRVLSALSSALGVQVLMVGDVAGTDIDAEKEYAF